MTPFEIVVSPYELWLAPVGTSFPDPATTPPSPWVKIGTNGNRNYTEDGVMVTHSQTLEEARVAGATGPIKATRTAEGLKIGMKLLDLTLEQYAHALNEASVTTTAAGSGTSGTKSVNLHQGSTVATNAMLVRGASPYDDSEHMQYQVPRVYQSGSPALQFSKKGAGTDIALEFTALEDPNAGTDAARFGQLVAANAAPQ